MSISDFDQQSFSSLPLMVQQRIRVGTQSSLYEAALFADLYGLTELAVKIRKNALAKGEDHFQHFYLN